MKYFFEGNEPIISLWHNNRLQKTNPFEPKTNVWLTIFVGGRRPRLPLRLILVRVGQDPCDPAQASPGRVTHHLGRFLLTPHAPQRVSIKKYKTWTYKGKNK